jgi:hypothetical protein
MALPAAPFRAAVQSDWDVDTPTNNLIWHPDPDEESLPEGYRVYRRASSESESILLATVGLVYAYTDATALPGVVYEYTIVGFHAGGDSRPISLALRTADGQSHSPSIS